MRRKEKYMVNGALILAGMGAAGDVLLQYLEHKERGEDFTWKKYNGFRTLGVAAVSGIAGMALGYGYYQYKIGEEENLPFSSDTFLNQLLIDENLKSNPALFQTVLTKREEVKQWLKAKFGYDLVVPPADVGSFKKRTAIVSNYDLDLVLVFKKNSCGTLEEMYNDVADKIYHAFSGEAIITKQTRAIGLTFNLEGQEIHFDIVPAREINNFIVDKKMNLYVRPEWVWERGGSFKTHIGIQNNITVNKPEARQVIKLFKIYRDRNGISLPTLLIEQCVVEALSNTNYGIHGSITVNFLNCMDFISKKMNNKILRDKANYNNNLLDKLAIYEKESLQNKLSNDLEEIEENPRYIKEIFE